MDAFELLKADHRKVAELFDLLETAGGKRKLDVFKRIKSELGRSLTLSVSEAARLKRLLRNPLRNLLRRLREKDRGN